MTWNTKAWQMIEELGRMRYIVQLNWLSHLPDLTTSLSLTSAMQIFANYDLKLSFSSSGDESIYPHTQLLMFFFFICFWHQDVIHLCNCFFFSFFLTPHQPILLLHTSGLGCKIFVLKLWTHPVCQSQHW